MSDITITLTEIVDGVSVESTPTTITVFDGVFVDSGGGGGGGTVDSVTAGNGTITIGGTATDPTVAATVGTSSGTVAAGNDSRITGAAQKSSNLSDLSNAGTARTNLGLATVAASGAYSDLSGKPTLGTAAAKDIPASGDASSSQVVYGTDTRLTDARTPTTHTHAESDVAGLVSDLAGKVPTTRTVAGHALSADVTVSKGDVGLGNVDNTADTGKPVSTAQQTALDLKANLASPTFTGTVTIPTATAADSTTKAASTAFVQGEIAAKAPLASPALTGNPTAPTQTAGNNSTRIATTAYVDGTFAPLASPALTGHPTGVTESAGDNSTRLASTAYVDTASGLLIPKSLLTTKGDIIARSSSAPVRVAVGSDGQVLTADAASTGGVKWATPSGGGGSGGILGYAAYNPGTIASYAITTTGTVTDIDATNLAAAFTAPSSGAVLVTLSGLGGFSIVSGSGSWLNWHLRSGSTTVATLQVTSNDIISGKNEYLTAQIVVSGLTPGNSYTYKWAWSLQAGSTTPTGRLFAGGVAGHAVVRVDALP